MSAATPGQGARSRVSVEATRLNEDETGWTEAAIFIERLNDHGHELEPMGMLEASPAELREVHERLKLYFEQGIWSFRTVERNDHAAQDARPAPDLEAAFANGMRVRTAPCTADAHDSEHFQVRTNGHWLCGHLLASMLAAQGITAGPEPKPAPELAAAIRAYCQQEADEFSAEMFPVRPQDMRVSAADILAIVDRVQPATAAPEMATAAPDTEATEMRAVIDMIWRMCQQPDGERLADRVSGLIKNSGMEPF